MSRFLSLVCVLTAFACSNASAKEKVEPIETEIQLQFCGSVTNPLNQKQVCYVYDIQTKKKYIEVRIAGGLILSGGTPILSAEGSAVIAATVRFPLGTSKKDAIESARRELNKKLKDGEVASFVKEQKEDPKDLATFSDAKKSEPKDPIDKILREIFEE